MKSFFLFITILAIPFSSIADEQDNLFIPLRHSLEMLDYDLACIKEAKQSIEMSLCFMGGKVFKKLLTAYEERLKNNPLVRIYILGSPMLLVSQDLDELNRLKDKYPGRFKFQLTMGAPQIFPDYCMSDNHIKCMIVDEKYFSLGGTNFDEALCTEGTTTPPRPGGSLARDHLPAGNRDYDIVGRGFLAKELRMLFFKHFALWKHYEEGKDFIDNPEYFADKTEYYTLDSKKGQAQVSCMDNSDKKVITSKAKLFLSGPYQKGKNDIAKEYVRLMNSAQKEIVIGNLYSCPRESIYNAMKDALQRGVGLTYVTNGNYTGAPFYCNFFVWANRINYVPFFYGKEYSIFESQAAARDPVCKTEIYEYHVPDVMYHKKVMVVDKRYVIIGGYNFGVKSDTYDFEAILSIDSEAIAKKVLEVFEEDKKHSIKITPTQARQWYFSPLTNFVAAFQMQFHGFL